VYYSWAMVAVSLLLWPLANTTLLYPLVAAILGAAFLREAHRLRARSRGREPVASMRLFHWSITYLSALFVAVGADAMLEHVLR
jgi:protoheme IX farnesyltransferase